MTETLGSHYKGQSGQAYSDWQVTATRGLGKLVAPKFQRYISSNAAVLDFGCGSGENLANIHCTEKMGVEPNEHSFAVLKERGITAYHSLREVPDQRADIIISHHALEHCLDPYEELCGMRRVMKPGGMLVLVLPIDDWRTQRKYDPSDINHHLFTWTPLLIGNLVEEAGFKLVEAKVLTYQWPPKVRFLSNNLPRPIFELLCAVWSVATKMREMRVVAKIA